VDLGAPGKHRGAFSAGGAAEAVVETDEAGALRPRLAPFERGGELDSVAGSQRVHGEQAQRAPPHAVTRSDLERVTLELADDLDIYANIYVVKRTTIYLDADQEVLIKLEMQRRGRTMADLVREALAQYLGQGAVEPPPGAGAFASGRTDTAGRAEETLAETGFGEDG
jgi:hypothetical protein